MRKKFFKFLKILILLILINQVVILLLNDSIREGWWKINSANRFNDHDFLKFDKNLKWNLIEEDGEISGIVQFYIGKKLVMSNLTLTEWYVYEHK